MGVDEKNKKKIKRGCFLSFDVSLPFHLRFVVVGSVLAVFLLIGCRSAFLVFLLGDCCVVSAVIDGWRLDDLPALLLLRRLEPDMDDLPAVLLLRRLEPDMDDLYAVIRGRRQSGMICYLLCCDWKHSSIAYLT